VRQGFTVEEIVKEGDRVVGVQGHGKDGESITERAAVVIGADGLHSTVARTVQPEQYRERPPIQCGYYSYFSNLPNGGRFEVYIRPGRGFAAIPTNDGLTMVVVGWPHREFEANKKDIEANFLKTIDLVPAFSERLRRGQREDRIYGTTVPNYFRKPYGPGWALIGDAGYNKDPITAQGISDAFRDAERLVEALRRSFNSGQPFDSAMAEYQAARDEHVSPMYEFTCELARLEPPPPRTQELLRAVEGNRAAMDDFCRMNAGTISPAVFFSPENIGPIMAAAQTRE
jgi:2-polyprenyl-6-methoxyphenol hydroxylase-like FAD-dependent oxidoreductase